PARRHRRRLPVPRLGRGALYHRRGPRGRRRRADTADLVRRPDFYLRTSDMRDLKNKVVAVTGGAGGIGHGIAPAILRAGDRVAAFSADVTDPARIDAALKGLRDTMGRLDGLVNNAGVVKLGPADETTPQGFDLEMAVNVKGVLLTAQAAAKHFGEAGSIV